MGFFDSNAVTENNELNDGRQTQAGNDVNQSPINVTGGGKKSTTNVNVTMTDHKSVQGALSLAEKSVISSALATEGMLERSSESERRMLDTVQALQKESSESLAGVVDLTDSIARRGTDLTLDLAKQNGASLESMLIVMDNQNRRNSDLQSEFVSTSENMARMAQEAAAKEGERMAAVNRQSLDFAERTQAKSNAAITSVVSDTVGLLDASERRVIDFAKSNTQDALAAMESGTKNMAKEFRETLEGQVDSVKDLAKSVSVGNEEGTNRIVMTLIIAVALVLMVAAGAWMMG